MAAAAILDVRKWSHFWPFQIDAQLFLDFFTKWPPTAFLGGTTMSIIKLARDIWMCNACAKFEEFISFKSYRADNEIVTRRRRTPTRLRCWRKHNIPENLLFSWI